MDQRAGAGVIERAPKLIRRRIFRRAAGPRAALVETKNGGRAQ